MNVLGDVGKPVWTCPGCRETCLDGNLATLRCCASWLETVMSCISEHADRYLHVLELQQIHLGFIKNLGVILHHDLHSHHY